MRSQIVPLLCLVAPWIALPSDAAELTLQDSRVSVTFDTTSGALTKLEHKSLHWMIERRPELGISFRLHAPLPQDRYNFVLGQKQHTSSVKKIAENKLAIEWKNLVSERGGVLPITFEATVTLENGSLTFEASLQNGSPLSIETVEYPYFGDLNPPARDSRMQLLSFLVIEKWHHRRVDDIRKCSAGTSFQLNRSPIERPYLS